MRGLGHRPCQLQNFSQNNRLDGNDENCNHVLKSRGMQPVSVLKKTELFHLIFLLHFSNMVYTDVNVSAKVRGNLLTNAAICRLQYFHEYLIFL